jgi:hypothetical protein
MKKLFAVALLAIPVFSYSQTVVLKKGNITPLKGQKSLQVSFEYDNMLIGKDGLTETAYIKRKKDEYNAKEAGRGEKWEKDWYKDRKERFEPHFIELFDKHSPFTIADKAEYTLIFRTTRTEPGWNVGVMRAPARIDAEVLIVETQNPNNILAVYSINNAPGRDAMGYDFDTGYRLQEAYAKSGKALGKKMTSVIK